MPIEKESAPKDYNFLSHMIRMILLKPLISNIMYMPDIKIN